LSSLYNQALFCQANIEDNGDNGEEAEIFTTDLWS